MSMPSSSDAVATSARKRAGLEPMLGIEPPLAREAAVMAGDLLFAQHIGEPRGDALGQLARVDEDQRRAVLVDQLAQRWS